jgi:hypothetical protein
MYIMCVVYIYAFAFLALSENCWDNLEDIEIG